MPRRVTNRDLMIAGTVMQESRAIERRGGTNSEEYAEIAEWILGARGLRDDYATISALHEMGAIFDGLSQGKTPEGGTLTTLSPRIAKEYAWAARLLRHEAEVLETRSGVAMRRE